MTPQERVDRAQRVAFLLNNETFRDACAQVEASYTQSIMRTAVADTEKRETLFAEYAGFRRVVAELARWRDDGDIAAAEIRRAG